MKFDTHPRLLLAILALAFGLRVVGVGYGLPDLYNSDEPFNVAQALSYGAKKSLEPTYFVYPTLYSYLLFAAYGGYFLVGEAVGAFDTSLDFALSYFLEPTGLFLVGRLLSVIFGVATVAVAYALGRRVVSRETGLLAALILALSFAHADRSHWILLEPAVGFFSGLALLLVIRLYEERTLVAAMWAGLLCGLAISTKYNAGFLLVTLLVCVFLAHRAAPVRLISGLGVALVAAVFGFLLGSPYWLFSFAEFAQALRYTGAHMGAGMVGHLSTMPVVWPLWQLLAADWSVGFLFLSGLIYAGFRREAKGTLLLLYAAATVVVVGLWTRTGVHYLYPILPALAVLAAAFLQDSHAVLRRPWWRHTLTAALLLPGLVKIAAHDLRLTQPDTRTVARRWIEAHLPVGSPIAYENYVYGPNLFDPRRFIDNPEGALLPLELRERLLQERHRRPSYVLVNLRKDFRTRLAGEPLAGRNHGGNPYLVQMFEMRLPKLTSVAKAGVRYLVVSSDNYARYFKGRAPEPGSPLWFGYRNGRRFYESVFRSTEWQLLKEFKPGRWNPGPIIRIYAFKG